MSEVTQIRRDIHDIVAHHDSQITLLGQRMTGVETMVAGLDRKVDNLSSTVAADLKAIHNAVTETKIQQGPQIKDIIVWGGILFGALGAAGTLITLLVMSIMSPDISSLKSSVTRLEQADEVRAKAELDELRTTRQALTRTVESRLGKVEEQLGTITPGVAMGAFLTPTQRNKP